MRLSDLVILACRSLRQRLLRTTLTILGIVIGSVLMLLTLAGGVGVARAVEQHYRGSELMRTIAVHAGHTMDYSAIPAADLDIEGEMSHERRERLQERMRQQHPAARYVPTEPMTPDTLEAWEQLPHVESVHPSVTFYAQIEFEDAARSAAMTLAPRSHSKIESLIVAGAPPRSDDAPELLVHEALLYEWGFHDEQHVLSAIGKPVMLKYHSVKASLANSLQWAVRGQNALTAEEARTLAESLGTLLDQQEPILPEEQTRLLARVLAPPDQSSEHQTHSGPLASETFRIAGVFRTPAEDQFGWKSGLSHLRYVDVILPLRSGRDFLRPFHEEVDMNSVMLIVDSEQALDTVLQPLRDEGYYIDSTRDFVLYVHQRITFLTSILAGLAFAAVCVAGLGIANTIAMTVLERTHEIGIMKAIGAHDWHILALFLTEGALLGALGSLLGLAVGRAVAWGISGWVRGIVEGEFHHAIEHPVFSFPLWLVLGVPLLVIVVTASASLFPARRAARIDPIHALRAE